MKNVYIEGLLWFLTVMNLLAMQVIQVQSLGWKDPLEKGNGNPFQYSCLGNPMDRGVWQATVRGVARVRHELATKPPPPPNKKYSSVSVLPLLA